MCDEFSKDINRVVVSVGGVLGARYMRTKTVGPELFRSSQAMRLPNRGRGWALVVEHGNSSSYAGRTALVERNVVSKQKRALFGKMKFRNFQHTCKGTAKTVHKGVILYFVV